MGCEHVTEYYAAEQFYGLAFIDSGIGIFESCGLAVQNI